MVNINLINRDTIDSVHNFMSVFVSALPPKSPSKFDDITPIIINFMNIADLEMLNYQMSANSMTVQQRENFEKRYAAKKGIDYSDWHTEEGIGRFTEAKRKYRESATDANGKPLFVKHPMDEKVLIPNVSKQSYRSIDEILTPDQLKAKRANEMNRINFRQKLQDMGVDPDSDAGLLANPYESYLARKSWLEVVARHKNCKKSEGAQFEYDFYTRDLKHIKPQDLYETNHTNKINFKGRILDVSELEESDVLVLARQMTINESNELFFTEHVQSMFQVSTPKVKLYYPEPYIASPSLIHEDLWILHILHYQFWLWFFFIFLVVFFFLVFLVTVRWNQNQNRPRRETRGVSRSKCGDLITACVPVSWAASIIISESTDSADITDGFSTGELVIGVRAYQWGWEYYYPKSIDLNYSVKPTYSAFVGNSIKYSTTSDLNNTTNHFWRHYQKKTLESVITPTHLLVLPFDNTNIANFANFNDAGFNTLKQSAAFSKIRANSKLFNTNIITNPTNFSSKFHKINKFIFSENSYISSNTYGSVRQHNLLSSISTSNNLSTFLNEKDLLTFLSNEGVKSQPTANTTNSVRLTDIINSEFYKSSTSFLNNVNFYVKQLDTINDSSDKKRVNSVLNAVISKPLKNVNYITDYTSVSKFYDLPTSQVQSFYKKDGWNAEFSILKNLIRGENTGVLASDQLVRNYDNIKLNSSNYNLSNSSNGASSFLNQHAQSSAIKNTFNTFSGLTFNLTDASQLSKLTSRRESFGYPHPLFFSNNPSVNIFEYDTNSTSTKKIQFMKNRISKNVNSKSTQTSMVLYGDQANATPQLGAAYWRMFWSGTDSSNRFKAVANLTASENNFYMPLFTNYYDYDFRNAQAIELLEDAFWESSYSSYNFYDYINLTQNYLKTENDSINNSRFIGNFLTGNTNFFTGNNPLFLPIHKETSLVGQFYMNSLESDDFTTPADLTLLKNFNIFSVIDSLTSTDESFNSYKNLSSLTSAASNALLYNGFSENTPVSYLSLFNNFRADFDDFSFTNSNVANEEHLFTDNKRSVGTSTTTRLSNPLVIRSGVKNSIVTFNALRKVFRARFDEGRSHTGLQVFAQSYLSQPFINDDTVPYTQLLSKDKTSFFQSTSYLMNPVRNLGLEIDFNLNQNYYFYDLPFLLSEGSDPQKFMWFDWWARWGMYEVQPSSVAKYSTLGVPYSRKHFDFGSGQGDNLQDVETYFIRISRLRKNYLPNWLYSPILLNKITAWAMFNLSNQDTYTSTKHLLLKMRWYDKTLVYYDTSSDRFTPSISGNSLYLKTAWRPFSGIQAYFYKNTMLIDILTKREHLYRKYLQVNKKIINLPITLTCNINNPLIDEIKASFLLNDPISYASESTRDFFYASLPFFKFMVFKDIIATLSSETSNLPINTTLINEYLFFYALNARSNKPNLNAMLYKDQHRPLKKGITNMLRLHGTGAVALPVEVRLQILASSRDVIHSWSIPSAGVKIDCVPGYTSHRIMTFNLTGIYWGQCQEICGRYHHWMPIIIYFMKRDLFFLWCTHFVFKSTKIQDWKITDKQYANYIRFVSYDKASWLNELDQKL